VTYGRPISDQLKTAISNACNGKFPDREISIGSSPSDDPSLVLAGELKSVLEKAGFKKLNDAIGRQIIVGSVFIGVVITGRRDDGLVRTLQSVLGSTKELLVVLNPKPELNGPVQIFVGARAFLPPSGETPEWLEFLNRHHLVAE
jgi:hypothetical protein